METTNLENVIYQNAQVFRDIFTRHQPLINESTGSQKIKYSRSMIEELTSNPKCISFLVENTKILKMMFKKFEQIDSYLDEMCAPIQVTLNQYTWQETEDGVPYETIWNEEDRMITLERLWNIRHQWFCSQCYQLAQPLCKIVGEYAFNYY